jgi:hypothetical protein
MTQQDIDILLRYLVKVVVPQNDHDAFILAVERLVALRDKAFQAA